MPHNNITLDQRRDFLRALELPELEEISALAEQTPVSLSETPKSASVDAGQVIAFSPDVTAGDKAAVLNSCLLAQLAATYQYDRETETVKWYDFYNNVLTNCGWMLNGFQFHEYQSSSASFGIDTFMVNLLAGLATGSMLSTVTAAINFLKSLSATDPRSLIFDHNSHSGKNGNFQLSACFRNSNLLTMSLGCSYFSASQSADNFFFLHFESANSHIYFSTQNITLDMDVFNQVKDDIVKKLGNKAKSFIQDLDI